MCSQLRVDTEMRLGSCRGPFAAIAERCIQAVFDEAAQSTTWKYFAESVTARVRHISGIQRGLSETTAAAQQASRVILPGRQAPRGLGRRTPLAMRMISPPSVVGRRTNRSPVRAGTTLRAPSRNVERGAVDISHGRAACKTESAIADPASTRLNYSSPPRAVDTWRRRRVCTACYRPHQRFASSGRSLRRK